MNTLSGKSCFITGGRAGIGRAIVECFINEDAHVITCGRGPRPIDLPNQCEYVTLDVANSQAVSACATSLPALDVLVNNAGVQLEKTVVDSTDEDWENVMGVNARGVFLMCRAMIPKLNDGGSIINIGSISGNIADPSMALYNASKAFVHGLTRSIAVDHGPTIRCNAICPGWIETGMLEAGFNLASEPDRAKQDALNRHPVHRFGQPEDIAAMALWLASDNSAFASGQTFTIDGGMSAASPLNPSLF